MAVPDPRTAGKRRHCDFLSYRASDGHVGNERAGRGAGGGARHRPAGRYRETSTAAIATTP
jgi:hypothetical protein